MWIDFHASIHSRQSLIFKESLTHWATQHLVMKILNKTGTLQIICIFKYCALPPPHPALRGYYLGYCILVPKEKITETHLFLLHIVREKQRAKIEIGKNFIKAIVCFFLFTKLLRKFPIKQINVTHAIKTTT